MSDSSVFPRKGVGSLSQETTPVLPELVHSQDNIWGSRSAEMAAIFMVGDGLIGLLQPSRHVDLWKDDALGTEKLVKPFVDRPGRRRLYAVVQIAAGLALAARQKR